MLRASPTIRGHPHAIESNTDATRFTYVPCAHVAAVQRTPGHQQAIAGSVGCLSQGKCQLRRKLTLNCAVQQGGVDPLPPIRRRPAIGRLVTTADLTSGIRFFRGHEPSVAGAWRPAATSANWTPGCAVRASQSRGCCHKRYPKRQRVVVIAGIDSSGG